MKKEYNDKYLRKRSFRQDKRNTTSTYDVDLDENIERVDVFVRNVDHIKDSSFKLII